MIDIIYKTVTPSHLEKLQIIQNVNKFNVSSHRHFFWLKFDRANHIIAWSPPVASWGNRFSKNSTWSFEWGTGIFVKMHRFNAFSWNMNTINWNIFPTHVEIYKSEEIQQAFFRDKTLGSFKKYERMYSPEANLKGQRW